MLSRFVVPLLVYPLFLYGDEPNEKKRGPVDVYVHSDETELVDKANFDLGSFETGETVKAEIRIHNLTDREFAYDKIHESCSCQSFNPSKATIPPGESIDAVLELRTASTPADAKSGGIIQLQKGGLPVCMLHFSYGLNKYLGFSSQLLLVDLDPDANEEVFSVPLVIGRDVPEDHLQFSLDLPSEVSSLVKLEYSVDREKSVLQAKVTLSKDNQSTIYGTLRTTGGNLDSNKGIPCIFRRRHSVEIAPRSLRFTQEKIDSQFEAILYVKTLRQKDKIKPQNACSVAVTIGGEVLNSVPVHLGNGVFRVKVTTSLENREKLEMLSKKCTVRLVIDKNTLEESLPFVFKEYER